MLEVKGRASIVFYWAIVGIVTSLLGWWCLDGVDELGLLWEILAYSLMVSGPIVIGMGMRKALDRRPMLVADQDGVLDRTSYPERKWSWTQIRGFRLWPENSRKPTLLAVDIDQPEQYIRAARMGNRAVFEAFQNNYGTPCVVSLSALDIEPNVLLLQLKERLKQQSR